jgi:hypothetical protein
MLSCAGGGGSEGDAVNGCWSSEFFRIESKLITTPMLVLVSSVVLGKRYGCYIRFIDATAVLEGRLIGFKLDVGCGLAREIRTGKRGATRGMQTSTT